MIFEATIDDQRFRIEEDLPEIGAYLRIYDGERETQDYLQDNVQICIEFALEKFGVPPEAWHELD